MWAEHDGWMLMAACERLEQHAARDPSLFLGGSSDRVRYYFMRVAAGQDLCCSAGPPANAHETDWRCAVCMNVLACLVGATPGAPRRFVPIADAEADVKGHARRTLQVPYQAIETGVRWDVRERRWVAHDSIDFSWCSVMYRLSELLDPLVHVPGDEWDASACAILPVNPIRSLAQQALDVIEALTEAEYDDRIWNGLL